MKPLQLPLIFMMLLFISCQKKISDLEFEKNVMTEIFPNLIDSICIDSRTVLNPPPIYGLLTYDENGRRISVDSTMSIEEQNKEWLSGSIIKKQLKKILQN